MNIQDRTHTTSYKDGSFGAIHHFKDARAKEYIAVYGSLGVGNAGMGSRHSSAMSETVYCSADLAAKGPFTLITCLMICF